MGNVKFDNSTYKFEDLETKYRNFFAPAYEIIVDGTDLTKTIAVSSLTVETSIKPESDSFSFKVDNAFDLVKREFTNIDKYLFVGKYVEIRMGYLDKLETVFVGIITSVSYNYPSDGNPSITVNGMDTSCLMMKGARSNTWKKKKDSDVIKSIASKYGLKMSVNDTPDNREVIEQYDETDFEFITTLAEENNYNFFIVGNTLYFRKPTSSTSPVITLTYGKNLTSFATEINLDKQVSQVIVRSYDELNSKVLEAKYSDVDKIGNNSKTGKDIMKALADYTTEYVYANVDSVNDALSLATSRMNYLSLQLVKGSGDCIGLPEIRAGRYIKFENLGSRFAQPLLLNAVTHQIDDSGYTINFEVGGNAI